jgi:hypothetical protein
MTLNNSDIFRDRGLIAKLMYLFKEQSLFTIVAEVFEALIEVLREIVKVYTKGDPKITGM